MAVKFNPFTGNLDLIDTTAAAGSTTQVQYNNAGLLAGSADLTWDDSGKELGIGGDISLDDGGTYTTTLQTVTATANRTISFPDATGTVALVAGSSGQVTYNNAGAQAGLTSANIGSTGEIDVSLAGAASTPPVKFTGTWFTGGTSTTTKPQLLIEPTGTTSTAWSTNGTGFGVNAPSGFAGNLLDLQVGGSSRFKASGGGVISFGSSGTKTLTQSNETVTLSDSFDAYAIFASYLIQDTNARVAIGAVDLNFASGSDLGIALGALSGIGWTTSSAVSGTVDLKLHRDAADTLAQRNGTNAQKTRIYDTYTSSTDYHRVTIATARATLSNVSGASVTATGLIPAGAVVMGVTSKVTTGLGTTNSTTGYKIGTGADDDRWGDITGTAAGTTSDNRDWTAGTIECFPAATDVIVTAVGGNFDATGDIYLSVQYMAGEAD